MSKLLKLYKAWQEAEAIALEAHNQYRIAMEAAIKKELRK